MFYDGDNTVYVNASSPSESIYRRLLGKEMIQKLFVEDKGTNKAYKEAFIAHNIRAMEVCAALGIPNIVVHAESVVQRSRSQ